MQLIKYGLPLVAALALGFGAATTFKLNPKVEIADPLHTPPGPEREKPHVYGSGVVEPPGGTIAMASPLSGLVQTVHVVAGQRVAKDEPLFDLDSKETRKEEQIRHFALEAKKAELERVKAGSHPDEIRMAERRLEATGVEVRRSKDSLERALKLKPSNAIAEEEVQQRRFALENAQALFGQAGADLDRLRAIPRLVDVVALEREIDLAQAQLERIRVDLERSVIRSPVDAVVLRVNVRTGEYLSTGFASDPSLILAPQMPLQVRAQIDEEELARLLPGGCAEAAPRNRSGARLPLRFIRIEPYVTPKKLFTGQISERLDTRVLSIIYELEPGDQTVYIGQQVDVFIEAAVQQGGLLSASSQPMHHTQDMQ